MKKLILLIAVFLFIGLGNSYSQSAGQDAQGAGKEVKEVKEVNNQRSSNDKNIDPKCAESNHSQHEILYDRPPKTPNLEWINDDKWPKSTGSDKESKSTGSDKKSKSTGSDHWKR